MIESQLSNNHKGLIETKTKSRDALIPSKLTEETKRIQKSKKGKIVISADNLAQAYRKCASDILNHFPTTIKQKMIKIDKYKDLIDDGYNFQPFEIQGAV